MPTTTTADGVQIHYERAGVGPAVVLVHGITDSGADWAPVDERLAVDRTVLTLDLRGHGRSGDAEDCSPLAMAADVGAVVNAADLSPPLVVGHGLGAAVVTVYAASAPVRAVVNLDQSLRFSDLGATLVQLEHQLKGSGFHAAMRAVFRRSDGPLMPEDLRAALMSNRDRARQEVVLRTWELMLTSSGDELDAITDAIGPAVAVPYLAIHGSDPGEGYENWLRQRLPQLQLERWANHGHYPHLVDPNRFVERLRRLERSLY